MTEPGGGELFAHFAVQLLNEGVRKGLDVGKVEFGVGGAVGAGGWEPEIELCGDDGDMVEAGGGDEGGGGACLLSVEAWGVGGVAGG